MNSGRRISWLWIPIQIFEFPAILPWLPMMQLWACSKMATEIGSLDFARAELVKTEFFGISFCFCFFYIYIYFIISSIYLYYRPFIFYYRFEDTIHKISGITDYRNKWSGEGQDIVKLKLHALWLNYSFI